MFQNFTIIIFGLLFCWKKCREPLWSIPSPHWCPDVYNTRPWSELTDWVTEWRYISESPYDQIVPSSFKPIIMIPHNSSNFDKVNVFQWTGRFLWDQTVGFNVREEVWIFMRGVGLIRGGVMFLTRKLDWIWTKLTGRQTGHAGLPDWLVQNYLIIEI